MNGVWFIYFTIALHDLDPVRNLINRGSHLVEFKFEVNLVQWNLKFNLIEVYNKRVAEAVVNQ